MCAQRCVNTLMRRLRRRSQSILEIPISKIVE